MQEIVHSGQPRRIAGRPLQGVGGPPERRNRIRCAPDPCYLYGEPYLRFAISAADGGERRYAPPALGGKCEIQRDSQPFRGVRANGPQAS